jgi:2'-5' RNA ligase
MKTGFFVVAELTGRALDEVREVQRVHDPKLASSSTPHITIVGSSGVGPIAADTPVERMREVLGSIAHATPPITVHFEPPIRFMQTEIVVLPLDPHGELRALHERIATSGLVFDQARFPFSPHCTLSFYPTITPAMQRKLLGLRIEASVVIRRLQVYQTLDPQPSRKVLEVELGTRGSGLGTRNGREAGSVERNGS